MLFILIVVIILPWIWISKHHILHLQIIETTFICHSFLFKAGNKQTKRKHTVGVWGVVCSGGENSKVTAIYRRVTRLHVFLLWTRKIHFTNEETKVKRFKIHAHGSIVGFRPQEEWIQSPSTCLFIQLTFTEYLLCMPGTNPGAENTVGNQVDIDPWICDISLLMQKRDN